MFGVGNYLRVGLILNPRYFIAFYECLIVFIFFYLIVCPLSVCVEVEERVGSQLKIFYCFISMLACFYSLLRDCVFFGGRGGRVDHSQPKIFYCFLHACLFLYSFA